MSAPEVSTRVTEQALATATALGLSLVARDGRPLDPARYTAAFSWVTWSEYLDLLDAMAGPGATPADHERLGVAIMDQSVTSPFRGVGVLMGGDVQLFEATYGWVMRSTIKVLRSEVTSLGPRRLRVVMHLDREAAPGQTFFHSALGTMRRLPSVLGMRDAHVEATIGSHEATYLVTLPPSRSFATRLRRAWSVLWDGPAVETAIDYLQLTVADTVTWLHGQTEEKAAEETRWRTLADSLPGLVVLLDADGRVADLHGAASRPAGLAPGRPLLDALAAEDRDAVAEGLKRAAVGEAVAVEARTADGRQAPRWWTWRAARWPYSPGGVVVVGIDVTDRHRAEATLRESERRYLHGQRVEAIGRLASGLAHDLNNVLAAIQGQAELLALQAGDREDVRRAATHVLDAVSRGAVLTRRVLASSRRDPATPVLIELDDMVRELVALLRRVIGENIRLETAFSGEPLLVHIDPSGLEQVVLNLAVNARDAMPGGGTIRLSTARDGAFGAVLTLSDTGTGMTPEVLARASEPFFTTKPVGLGSGLGLATVKAIVAETGGRVEIESAPGRGTTVRVYLPTADAPVPRPPTRPAPAPPDGAGARVFLVEDQDAVRDAIVGMITVLGYRVRAFSSGAAALAAVDEGDVPVLVVTDLVMPGMTGMDLARALRARHPELPLLFVSGFTTEDPANLGGITHGYRFLRKPFRLPELGEALAALVPSARPPAR